MANGLKVTLEFKHVPLIRQAINRFPSVAAASRYLAPIDEPLQNRQNAHHSEVRKAAKPYEQLMRTKRYS